MAFNVAGAIELSTSVFGGLVTEQSPSDVPEGCSPDCQDVVFAPGKVSSRPGLRKVFATPFPNGAAVVWGKTFKYQTGVQNLYLDSLGIIWMEDVQNSPGTYTQIATTLPGAFAKSTTAFNREYIAISDGLHGADVPLQWDGTNLDRVTQDGPGSPPAVTSFSLPSVAMAVTAAPATLPVTEADPGARASDGSFAQIFWWTPNSVANIAVGNRVSISGNASSPMNVTNAPIIAIYTGGGGAYANLIVLQKYSPPGTVFGLGGTATIGSGTTATRAANIVTIKTATAHQLQVGNLAQISGLPAQVVGTTIASVVIANEDAPGLATVTTAAAHGLVPGLSVTINGVVAVTVGGTISSADRVAQIVTIVTSTAHKLVPGAVVTIGGVSDTTFNTTVTVLNVLSPTSFTFVQLNTTDASSSGGTVKLNWPIPAGTTPQYFQVVSVPTSTSFQIQVSYSNGTWGAGGTVSYAWNGRFFVKTVVNATTFQYLQYGPDGSSSTVGSVKPYGQASEGRHQLQVLFLTRQGYTTQPSPPVSFIANGGQYISVSNIPIGPSNVVARILAFTGSGGAYFFYIPVPAQVNGQVVSTGTQINDNTTTSAVLDFSDNTLFAALAISIPGNNLAAEIVLEGALGFGFYGSRLISWGQRNRIQNLLNLGFDGGFLPSNPTIPTGWTVSATGSGGTLASGHYGSAWLINTAGSIFQSFYQDAYSAPIATPNTRYTARAWIQGVGAVANLTISSVTTGLTSTAALVGTSATGSYVEAAFSAIMPARIPADMILSLLGSGSPVVDEISIIYSQTPYLDGILYGSYVNNPEGFDGLSGKFGPSNDTRKVMDLGIVRNTLYVLSQEPSGRLHSTNDNGVTEPAGWTFNQVGSNCGLLSAFCLAKSQADDETGSGGEEWLAWASASGARIFGGDQPWKISQEIQPDWDSINPAAWNRVWCLNDPTARVIYFGVPTGAFTSPNLIYPMSYRALDTPYQIFSGAPFRTGQSGHLVATDQSRKWTRWNLGMNGASLMARTASGALSLVLFGNYGNPYVLDQTKLTDDDYGLIVPSYVTYFHGQAVQESLKNAKGQPMGAARKQLQYFTAYVSGVGQLYVTAYVNKLANAWPITSVSALALEPSEDLEWSGGSVLGTRIAFRFTSSPTTGLDNALVIQKVTAFMQPAAHLPDPGRGMIRNLEYLRTLASEQFPDLGAKLYEALSDIDTQQQTIAQQVNGNATGQPTAPPAISSLTVTARDGHFTAAIRDDNEIYRGVQYFLEHSESPQFTNPQIVKLGDSRNFHAFLGNSTRYFRAYSSYASSPPSAPAYHGGAEQPAPVIGGGSIPGPEFLPSQGSGTGPQGVGLQGPGTIPFRSATGVPPVR